MRVHEAHVKVFMEWYGIVYLRPIMWALISGLGVYDAIVHFNDGAIVSLEIWKDMNMEPGDHIRKGLYT